MLQDPMLTQRAEFASVFRATAATTKCEEHRHHCHTRHREHFGKHIDDHDTFGTKSRQYPSAKSANSQTCRIDIYILVTRRRCRPSSALGHESQHAGYFNFHTFAIIDSTQFGTPGPKRFDDGHL